MKKIIGTILLVAGMILVPGCTQTDQIEPLNEQISTLQKENETLTTQIEDLTTQIDTLSKEKQALEEEIKKLSEEEYTIYSRDVDSWEIIEVGKVGIDKDKTLQEKLQNIADELSKTCFEGLEISVEGIKTIGKDEIATINLKDKDENLNWMNKYFQGSAGAGVTKTALEETLLQRNINYPWIDGIEIIYNGEMLSIDHIELGDIIYR